MQKIVDALKQCKLDFTVEQLKRELTLYPPTSTYRKYETVRFSGGRQPRTQRLVLQRSDVH